MQGEYYATFAVDNAVLNSTAENHSCLVITSGAACDYCVSHKAMIGYHVNIIYQCFLLLLQIGLGTDLFCRFAWLFGLGSACIAFTPRCFINMKVCRHSPE